MDVMNPTLINIGGRCYRKMPFTQKIEHHSDQVSGQHYEGQFKLLTLSLKSWIIINLHFLSFVIRLVNF